MLCSCFNESKKQCTHSPYTVISVMPEDIIDIADSSNTEYTAICTYQYICDLCREEFPIIYNFCDTLPISFFVLFTVRESDSIYICESIQEIRKLNANFNNFLILSDSLYDIENRKPHKTLFKEYGGPREGQKHIKYVDNYIPDTFDKGCYTPRIFLYKKNQGIVFATKYNEEEETCFSSQDIAQIVDIIHNN